MGTSTDAILCYGVNPNWDEGGEPWAEEEDYDPGDWLNSVMGSKKHGLCMIMHCSGDYPMWLTAVSGSETVAYRGGVEKIDPTKMTKIPKKWADDLNTFVKKSGLKVAPPSWMMVSYWG